MGGMVINNRNVAKIFQHGCKYIKGTFNNDTGAELQLVGGELIGRDSTSGKFLILKSAGANGSNIPLGINRTCFADLADGVDIDMHICVEGDVAKDLVIFDGSDTVDTVVSGRTLGDRIIGDTAGIYLIEITELTDYDNQ